ncbi:hypothetical protein N9H39_07690 [Gammaproteobacteria bacterium]|nr:hypothetical protein [Gammaproteobacteria bacterium]
MAAILSRYQAGQSARLSINVLISKEKWSLDAGFRTNTRAAMCFRERTSIGTPKFNLYLRCISLVSNKNRPSIESLWGRHFIPGVRFTRKISCSLPDIQWCDALRGNFTIDVIENISQR